MDSTTLTKARWSRWYPGHYVWTVVLDEELTRDRVQFLPLHFTVRRVEDGRWEATYRRGDDALKAPWECLVSFGTYRTMREAREVCEHEVVSRNRSAA